MKKGRFIICMGLAAMIAGPWGEAYGALAQTQGNGQPSANNTSVQGTTVFKGKVTPAERKAAAARRAAALKKNLNGKPSTAVGKEGQK
jgi:hypothetical protein